MVMLPLMHEILRYRKFSETQKGSSKKCFGTVRQNYFDGKSSYPLPRPPMHENFPCQNFSEGQKGSITKFFRTVKQKMFDRKS